MVRLKNNSSSIFRNKNILITGGTGSIGVGISKQLLKHQPNRIRILTNDENSIFEFKQIFGENDMFTFLVGDIRDKERLEFAIRDIDIVFHTAAMKHVDICENNPFDAVKTNVIGTSNILEASLIENVSKFILISTDKATSPTSTLGASKLLAERLTLNASSYRGHGKTIFSIVRFGNVIGSRGSVFQIFLHQILSGKQLTVTDSQMTRFIMSISQAAKMILDVTSISDDGEIYILKMPSTKILNLSERMMKICNSRYGTKLSKIKLNKARKGERLHEFLISNEEISYCHDIGDMYKISKTKTKKIFPFENFSSEHVKKISDYELDKIISELLDEI